MIDYKSLAMILLQRAGGEVSISAMDLADMKIHGPNLSLECEMNMARNTLIVHLVDPLAPMTVSAEVVGDSVSGQLNAQTLSLPGPTE